MPRKCPAAAETVDRSEMTRQPLETFKQVVFDTLLHGRAQRSLFTSVKEKFPFGIEHLPSLPAPQIGNSFSLIPTCSA